MKLRKSFNTIALLFLAVILFSCANEVAPTGGPKDVTPPKTLSSLPENYSVEFSETTIVFEFDEYVKLNNVKQKLMVSPPLDKDPEITQKGKKVIVKLKAPLKENVTYNFFFDDAIVDFNEGNAIKNFTYIVSTGSFLDSLSLEGTLTDALTLKPVENAIIILHTDLSDSAFIKEKPYYLTKTNKEGHFHFTHLKDTIYKIFALKDLNNTYTFDLITEDIAFYDSAFTIDGLMHINLFSFQETDTIQKIIEKKATQLNTMQLVFKFPPKEPSVNFYNTLPEIQHIVYSDNKDTLTIFTSGIDTVFCTVFDNEQFIDSIRVIVNNQRLARGANLKITPQFGSSVYYKNELFLDFNNFIKEMLCDSVRVIMSVDTIIDTTFVRMQLIEPENIAAKIDLPLEMGKKYQLFISDSAFVDINGSYNKSFNSQISIVNEDAFGNLILKFKRKPIVLEKVADTLNVLQNVETQQLGSIDIVDDALKMTVSDSLLLEEIATDSLIDISAETKIVQKMKYFPADTIPECNVFFVEMLNSKQNIVAQKQFTLSENDSVMFTFEMMQPGDYSLRIVYDTDSNGKWTTGSYADRRQAEKIFFPKNLSVKSKWDVEELVEIP